MTALDQSAKPTRVRYMIIGLLFVLTTINYADRATMSIAGTAVQHDLGISSISLGYIFSAFGWAYVIGQIPGGALLDRFGSKKVYLGSILAWSLCTFSQGFASWMAPASAVIALFILRFMLGIAESPSFPANARIVAAWFPDRERGTATAIFNSAQYAALIFFAPLMGWVTERYSWHYVFFIMGTLGVLAGLSFYKIVHAPHSHPRINKQEFDYLTEGGALTQLDKKGGSDTRVKASWFVIRQLLTNRMLCGIYIGQYCITALTYFFATWFPIYLVKERGMSITEAGFGAAAPAICGVAGGILGGILSDRLIKRGNSVSVSRKTPFVIGMLLSVAVLLCNFTESETLVLVFMALAFFGKGLAALGWAIIADAAPRQVTGLSGGIFNAIGNIAGIVTPIGIGYIVQKTGSFDLALVFVAAHSVLAMFSYLVIVGPIRRFTLRLPDGSIARATTPSAASPRTVHA
ncbi:MAG: sugar (glucarate) transporter permease [Novosphingobium lindaniclasticum]|jgi:ACS family glucarate transporter-like MFS transporter|uniref:MFS transporter n=1 Tax=Novosphingobium lindaniclasticum TaxID=1329895 RepID=UPI00240A8FE0|nr:MFS transporter [Novosphingobium lindaniclasticum]MDF2638494.1 sugar (glucarate) transporter permease [Novosphingobium lindaniclasticum]